MDWFLYDRDVRHEKVNYSYEYHPNNLLSLDFFSFDFWLALTSSCEEAFYQGFLTMLIEKNCRTYQYKDL